MKTNLISTPHIDKDGTKRYLLPDGITLHREDGPAIENSNGYKHWFFNGNRHRADGPAIECPDGDKQWWINGKRHRADGPALEHPNGDKYYFLNGLQYSFDEWNRLRKMIWAL